MNCEILCIYLILYLSHDAYLWILISELLSSISASIDGPEAKQNNFLTIKRQLDWYILVSFNQMQSNLTSIFLTTQSIVDIT